MEDGTCFKRCELRAKVRNRETAVFRISAYTPKSLALASIN